ncbi:MAG: hypothetical protein IK062_06710 [Selenomonadaceae bacterium]|nr:hypothetical protein [Selenomonadaceae bacterium]
MGLIDKGIDFITKIFFSDDEKEKIKLERDAKLKFAEMENQKILMESDAKINEINARAMAQIAIDKSNSELKLKLREKESEKIKLERDAKLKIADKEIEKINLIRDAQKELIEVQTECQIAIEKARAEGMTKMVEQMGILQEKMLDVAQKRIAIIEEGSLPIIREIENFYNEVGEKIQSASDDYNTKKLPQLLQILRQYEKDSPEHEIYFAQIQDDRARNNQFVIDQLQKVGERQNLVLQSFLSAKEKIIENTGQITQQITEGYIKKAENFLPPSQNENLKFLPKNEIKFLQEKS